MKSVSAEEAVALIPNGASIMVGGFMGVGTPERLLDELVRQKKSGLSLISNDAATPGKGVGKLFEGGQVSRMIGTHIGLNPKAQQQMLGNKISVELIPLSPRRGSSQLALHGLEQVVGIVRDLGVAVPCQPEGNALEHLAISRKR